MRASIILRQICRQVAGQIHAARVAVLLAAVDALVQGGRLTLTALGRRLRSAALPKHRIKRIDRLLSNRRMQAELPRWYAAVARRLLMRNPRPIILLDWTQTVGRFHALVAATPFLGRALPIYAEVHPEAQLGSREVQEQFLRRLADVLVPGTIPIIVADAGFRSPFLLSLRRRGWNYVIRLRGAGFLRGRSRRWREPDPRVPFHEVFAKATDHARCLGKWTPYGTHYYRLETRIVLGPRPRPDRRRRGTEAFYARRALEPWLLATSLDHDSAQRIVGLYALRMQIEETFRDAKNARLGWALEHAGSRDRDRQAVLLLIGCLGLVASILVGAAVEAHGHARCFQANTVRGRRVQSLFHLGTFVLGLQEPVPITARDVLRQRHQIAKFRRSWIQLCLPATTLRLGKLI